MQIKNVTKYKVIEICGYNNFQIQIRILKLIDLSF
jgi:hypothetical protein